MSEKDFCDIGITKDLNTALEILIDSIAIRRFNKDLRNVIINHVLGVIKSDYCVDETDVPLYRDLLLVITLNRPQWKVFLL